MNSLDDALIDAHADDDKPALVALYSQAATEATSEEARGFYLTHAYIFALEIGAPVASSLKSQLAAMGREIP